jgi:membrane associated rhomboid family serine protease/Zn-finger nucleic acid-binding protein
MNAGNGSEFICPRCNFSLDKVQISGRIFWGCKICGGRAVTVELLRRTFTPESINPLWLNAVRDEGKSSCACPSCRKPMIEVALSERANINVDVCRFCHLVWLDARETEDLIPLPTPPPERELPQQARELIAIEKVKQLAEEARGTDFDSAAPDETWKQIAAFFGMPVEFDTVPQERRPWTTWILCAVIICASVLAFKNLHEIVGRFGLIPAQPTRLHGLTFLTSFFLHAGVIHLIGNIYFLFVFGDDVENFLLPFRYLALIALAAFIGDIAHIVVDPRSMTPCIGASGGIAGVITFYALKFPYVKLGFLFRWGFVWFRWIRFPASSVFILWIFFQAIGAREQVAGISSVSSFAHLGGAAAGVVAWLLWRSDSQSSEASRL